MIFWEYASPIPGNVSRSAFEALLRSIWAPDFLSSLAGSALAASFLAGAGAVFVWATAGAHAAPRTNVNATRTAMSRVTWLLLSLTRTATTPRQAVAGRG